MKLVRLAALGAALAVLAAFAGVGLPAAAHGETAPAKSVRSITVSGSGSVSTVPDSASFSFGVTTEGRTATATLNANAAEMQKVIAAIKNAGVAAADVQTTAVSLSPRYSQNGEAIVGYTASNTVLAKIRDVKKSGAVIDAAVSAGANQVFGPSLTRSDQTALYRQALRAAVANARAKAQSIAGASKVRLGRVLSVTEASAGPPPTPLAREKIAAETPIEPGTQLIEATVTVEFAIS